MDDRFCWMIVIVCSIHWVAASRPLVINEVHYNPPEEHLEDGSLREFIELYNPGSISVDLSGYYLEGGIDYRFESGTSILPGSFLVIARDPRHSRWRNLDYRLVGPYRRQLSDEGERLTLRDPFHTIIDTMEYADIAPWPQAPDGYGSSLERISWELDSDDYHSWRSSTVEEGTPGRKNSVTDIPPVPVIRSVARLPETPSSSDPVTLRIDLDGPSLIDSVMLNYETILQNPTSDGAAIRSVGMALVSSRPETARFEAIVPSQPSQTLVRCVFAVRLKNGVTVTLPHAAEPVPFVSYFVYDGELDTTLPVLWTFHPQRSALLSTDRTISAVACLPLGQAFPDLFEGAILIPSASQRYKVRFLKGAEFYGDRTINIIPEIPTGGTNAGISSPYREHLGFWLYRQCRVPSSWADFYRVIRFSSQGKPSHTQQLVVQQVNEKFLEMNGRNSEGDLYKLVYTNPNWEKHTNKSEGTESIQQLLRALQTSNMSERRFVIETQIEEDEFLDYSAASILLSNWDGYWNNNWMYLNPETSRWEIYPWDLDWCWGATPPPNEGPMYFRMPLRFPIDGVAVGDERVSRPPGPVTSPLHGEPVFYERYLERLAFHFHRQLNAPAMRDQMDSTQKRLLDDLRFIEQTTGRTINQRMLDIRNSYRAIEQYIENRRGFLAQFLPTSILEWRAHENSEKAISWY